MSSRSSRRHSRSRSRDRRSRQTTRRRSRSRERRRRDRSHERESHREREKRRERRHDERKKRADAADQAVRAGTLSPALSEEQVLQNLQKQQQEQEKREKRRQRLRAMMAKKTVEPAQVVPPFVAEDTSRLPKLESVPEETHEKNNKKNNNKEEKRQCVDVESLSTTAASSKVSTETEGDDMFDIFGDDNVEEDPVLKQKEEASRAAVARARAVLNQKEQEAKKQSKSAALAENWDDAEGYYTCRPGDIIGGKYEVFAKQGRGVYSSVLRVRDLSLDVQGDGTRPEFVVKVLRSNALMYRSGVREMELLRKFAKMDPDGRHHVVRLLGEFEHKKHLCLVFEPMDCNLRQLLDKLGGQGLNLRAVQEYARQLLLALRFLAKMRIKHCDFKPDNILVNRNRTAVKVCDLGTAVPADAVTGPEVVARFYRAPEIMLGLPSNSQLDMWSLGCVLFELYTGKFLFEGKDNNEQLRRFIEVKGTFPVKLLRMAGPMLLKEHFNTATMTYEQNVYDSVTGQFMKRAFHPTRPTRSLLHLLQPEGLGHMAPSDRRKLTELADLLERMLVLDPAKRTTPSAALKHPFIAREY